MNFLLVLYSVSQLQFCNRTHTEFFNRGSSQLFTIIEAVPDSFTIQNHRQRSMRWIMVEKNSVKPDFSTRYGLDTGKKSGH